MARAGVPLELQGVPSNVLEDYITARLKELAVPLAAQLNASATSQQIDTAVSHVLYMMQPKTTDSAAQLGVRFSHGCRYLGCMSGDCMLCKNNPNKTCAHGDHFDGAYADSQVLRAKCEAEIGVELYNRVTGQPATVSGVTVLLSVVDGDSYNDNEPSSSRPRELLKADDGAILLKCETPGKVLGSGHVVVQLQGPAARLPDVAITDKNDTFQPAGGGGASTFRLMAVAARWDEGGATCTPLQGVPAAVSAKFVVKTQRALNDYRKSEFPHYKDELTRLRYIGAITATRLKDVRATVNPGVPMTSVTNVQELKGLLEYAESDRATENKLLELLNMRGKHKHKWDYLKLLLAERIVYDDNVMRVWYHPDGDGKGLLYFAKQAQVAMERPAGLLQRVMGAGGPRVKVLPVDANSSDSSREQLRSWAELATADWHTPSHPGWSVLTEPVEWVNSMVPPAGLAGSLAAGSVPGGLAPTGSGGGAGGGGGGFSFPSSNPAPLQQQYPPVNAPGMPLLHPPGSISASPSSGPILRSGSGYGMAGAGALGLGGAAAAAAVAGSPGGGGLQQQGLGGVARGFGHPLPMSNPTSTSGSHLQPGLAQQQPQQQQQQQYAGGAYPPVAGFMMHPQQQQQQAAQQQQMMSQPAMVPGSPPALVPTFVPVFTPHLQHQSSLGSQMGGQMNQQQGGMGLVSQPTHSGSGSWAQQMHSAQSHGGHAGGGGGMAGSPLMQHHQSTSMLHSHSVTVTPNEEGEDVALIHTSGSGYAGAMSSAQPLLEEVSSQPPSHAVSAPSGSFLQKNPMGMDLFGWEQVDSKEHMAEQLRAAAQGPGFQHTSLSAPGNLINLPAAPATSGSEGGAAVSGSLLAVKRGRPPGAGEMAAAIGVAPQLAPGQPQRSLKHLYHTESHGRHAPRSRTTADEGHASAPLAQSLMVIEDGDAGWLDFLDAQDLPGPGEPAAALRGPAAGGASSMPGSVGPSSGGAAPTGGVFGLAARSTSSTGLLSANLHSQLNIADASSPFAVNPMAAAPAATSLAPPGALDPLMLPIFPSSSAAPPAAAAAGGAGGLAGLDNLHGSAMLVDHMGGLGSSTAVNAAGGAGAGLFLPQQPQDAAAAAPHGGSRQLRRSGSDSFKLMIPDHLQHTNSEVDEALRRMGVSGITG